MKMEEMLSLLLYGLRLFKTNDVVSECFVKISNMPIFFVEKV